jgi:hypothetical protein
VEEQDVSDPVAGQVLEQDIVHPFRRFEREGGCVLGARRLPRQQKREEEQREEC